MSVFNSCQHACCILVAFSCYGGALLSGAPVPESFKSVNNALGAADRQGNFAFWQALGDGLDVADNLELPLALMFNSSQKYCTESCVGYGWWFPMLESTVGQIDENNLVMFGPGGYPFYFVRDTKNPEVFLTKDFLHKGQQTSGSDFEVESDDGWKFYYHKGRLARAHSPGGDDLKWNYAGIRVVSIVSQKKGELLRAKYDPQSSLLTELELGKINAPQNRKIFKYEEMPLIVRGIGEMNTIGKMVPTLAELIGREGIEEKFSLKINDELTQYDMLHDRRRSGEVVYSKAYSWDALIYSLLSDSGSKYQIEKPSGAWGYASIRRMDKDGRTTACSFDSAKGVWEHLYHDGVVEKIQYVLTPGANYGKMRQISRKGLDGLEEKRFYYDDSGRTLRTISSKGQGGTEEEIFGLDSEKRLINGNVLRSATLKGEEVNVIFGGGDDGLTVQKKGDNLMVLDKPTGITTEYQISAKGLKPSIF